MGMDFKRKLPIPKDIKNEFPIGKKEQNIKEERDAEIKKIFMGDSDKFLLIIGPCSADYPESVLEYIEKLRVIQDEVKDKIFIIPRIYTNKPRTTGAGYKGMLHQPDPDKNPDMLNGIIAIRQLHMKALKDYGFTCADEMLYPSNHRYLSDLLSYVAVGARSVENQEHRLVSSGMDTPVGMKNPTGGDLTVMMNAISAAQHGHTFIYRGWEVKSDGNPLAHAILRGYTGLNGDSVANYHYENLAQLDELYKKSGLLNPSVIIDTNHANSAKKYLEQPRIAKDVIYSCTHNDDIKKLVKGLMVESYLEDGCQKIGDHVYGKSITDPCIGWKKTEKLIYNIAHTI
ncbi:MAG: 3-deoxy-7-phosphoheptulonate synthase [Ruminococcaceae bacterium]|nr:3-deoxy-7-phosphoheptulonate synthase [Oscillospiraceae bacterium]